MAVSPAKVRADAPALFRVCRLDPVAGIRFDSFVAGPTVLK